MAKITNEMRYKTAEERVMAFHKWVGLGLDRSVENFAHWLALEAEDAKPENCPFCASSCRVHEISNALYAVKCDEFICNYSGSQACTKDDAVAAHNRVARAVRAAGESEVK